MRPSDLQPGGVLILIENKPDESICYAVDNHPQDSRISIREDGVVQTLPTNQTWGGVGAD